MTFSEACVNLVKQSEGCQLNAYQDSVGVWTIGYGHTGSDVSMGLHWTLEQAEEQLGKDLEKACQQMQNAVKVTLTQGQTDALTDWVFNLGIGALESSTLLRKLNNGWYGEIPAEIVRWNHAGGNVLAGLVVRRQKEVDLWNSEETA